MRKFEDENGNIITLAELQKEFNEKQQNDPETYDYTFNNYIRNCTDKSGTLTEITINREKMPITELEKIYKEYKEEYN